MSVRSPWRPARPNLLGAEVTGSCEHPAWILGTELRSSHKHIMCSWTFEPPLQAFTPMTLSYYVLLYFKLCVSVLVPVWVHAGGCRCPWKSQTLNPPKLEEKRLGATWPGCWELDSGLLQEQAKLLTTEPSLQLLTRHFRRTLNPYEGRHSLMDKIYRIVMTITDELVWNWCLFCS